MDEKIAVPCAYVHSVALDVGIKEVLPTEDALRLKFTLPAWLIGTHHVIFAPGQN